MNLKDSRVFWLSLHTDQCFNNPNMSITTLTPKQLRTAADLQEKIANLQSDLAAILGSETKAAPIAKAPKKKGGMSAAGKARIAAAQKLRWAKIKVAKPAAAKPVQKKKGGMSAAGKARIVAAQKLRWAKVKAAKPAVVKPVQKKKGGMSAAGKAKIAAAQKLRWAKVKAAKPASVVVAPKTAPKPAVVKPAKKGGMSAAAKAKLSAMMKARWAAKKAGAVKK